LFILADRLIRSKAEKGVGHVGQRVKIVMVRVCGHSFFVKPSDAVRVQSQRVKIVMVRVWSLSFCQAF
jgi:hypothetical protein